MYYGSGTVAFTANQSRHTC